MGYTLQELEELSEKAKLIKPKKKAQSLVSVLDNRPIEEWILQEYYYNNTKIGIVFGIVSFGDFLGHFDEIAEQLIVEYIEYLEEYGILLTYEEEEYIINRFNKRPDELYNFEIKECIDIYRRKENGRNID